MANTKSRLNIKVVVVGDGAVGKTCLILSYTTNSFPDNVLPTVFDNYSFDMMVDNKYARLGIWDTAGQSDFDRLRPMSYRDTDIFLVCFSVASPTSLSNVNEKWAIEVKHYGPDVPLVLCGTQADLRNDDKTIKALKGQNQQPVTREQGEAMSKAIGATSYVECSAITMTNVKEVFDACARAAIKRMEERAGGKKGCCVVL